MATLTKGKTFANGELVTPQKLHELVDLGTVSGIVNADIAAGAAIADSKLAQITTANKVANSATTATQANTANALVARDASGNFSAGTITAALSGNSATATTLQTARTINGVSFNGSANITITADPNAHTHDDRYYTETEINTLLSGKQAAGNYAPATGIAPSAITGTAVVSTDSRLSDARTPTSHTHDDRYYTETEINNLLSGKQAAGNYAPATGIAPSAITGTAVITTDSRLSDARTPIDASVTPAKFNTATQQLLVPTGAIMAFAMNSVPTGWLAANGAEVSRFIYDGLFAAIGTLYGVGNGSNIFNLPDLRGYFVRGAGTNADGTASGTFGAKQQNTVGPHTHGYDDYYQSSSLSKTNDNDRADGATIRMTNVNIVETGANLDRTTKSQSPAGTTETRPDNIAMLYCIKF